MTTSDSTTPDGELIFTDFVDVGPELGLGSDDYEAECDRLDDCYTLACEGTSYTILARPARRGEAGALYAETSQGLQILGCSVPVPEDVEAIRAEAWRLFCDG